MSHDPTPPDDMTQPPAAPGTETPEPSPVSAPAEPDEPRGRGRWAMAAAASLGVALFAVPLLRGPQTPAGETTADAREAHAAGTCATAKGRANFDFTLKDIDGRSVRLSDYKGKVILLNFWATWCGPCKMEIPELVEAYAHYRHRGLVILGVLSEDDPPEEDLRAFMNDFGVNYPVLRENVEFSDSFGQLWALPTSFIIDRHGTICTKHMGVVSKEMLEREIKGLL
jgi:peroxiredoxin